MRWSLASWCMQDLMASWFRLLQSSTWRIC